MTDLPNPPCDCGVDTGAPCHHDFDTRYCPYNNLDPDQMELA